MRILLLGSHMNYNLEHYVYMNLVKLGHEVEFYGYKDGLGKLANPIRMAITSVIDHHLACLKINE